MTQFRIGHQSRSQNLNAFSSLNGLYIEVLVILLNTNLCNVDEIVVDESHTTCFHPLFVSFWQYLRQIPSASFE